MSTDTLGNQCCPSYHFKRLRDLWTHSSVLAWRIPGTGGPGGLPSMGSHRVGHNWSDLAAAAGAAAEAGVYGISQVALVVKNPPANLGVIGDTGDPWVGKIPWRKEMAIHSSIFTQRIPMDRGAWWAPVLGVTKSWTRLSEHACMHARVYDGAAVASNRFGACFTLLELSLY